MDLTQSSVELTVKEKGANLHQDKLCWYIIHMPTPYPGVVICTKKTSYCLFSYYLVVRHCNNHLLHSVRPG